ncbi:RBBP9/YdeN family alpha/beta hydrolase [Duganella sp. CT11-25]|jgi:predicted alpha/beta hydrolase family esterase|uniref:RBBP9/YdeN family alpha/beta hydrolase n=1 Tax=unclassified Duganella TaxID=2636909 RepID=UPI0039AFE1E6
MQILIVPGIGNSGPDHWQSRWQASHEGLRRMEAGSWDEPECGDWVAAIERAMVALGPDTLIVAHSLGCLAVAHWAATTGHAACRAALLVAVPDPRGPAFPAAAHGFAPLPERRFDFPSLIVASGDDPYAGVGHARHCARAWGSGLHDAGKLGHINAASGLGDWPEGWELLEQLKRSSPAPASAA